MLMVILGCMRQGFKAGIHNCLRNTVHRYANMAGLSPAPALEPTSFLSDDKPDQPILATGQLAALPVAVDLAVTSPLQATNLSLAAPETLFRANQYADRKRDMSRRAERCVAANLGYELVVFESLGETEVDGRTLLESVCSQVDEALHRKKDDSHRECSARMSFGLQRGLHRAIAALRTLCRDN